jgi:hypothetical protein
VGRARWSATGPDVLVQHEMNSFACDLLKYFLNGLELI